MTIPDLALPALKDPGRALVEEYLAGYSDHLTAIRTDLLAIARDGADANADQLVKRVVRSVRSIRGAGFFGLVKIGELAQRMEEALALIRAERTIPKPYQVGILLLATDRLCELVQNPDNSNQSDIVRIVAALGRLQSNPPAASVIARQSRRVRVLAVEDDLSSRILLQSFFSRFGDCHLAVNGIEAVEAFRSALEQGQSYDLICMDIMMPEMGGREALRQVRALEEAASVPQARGVRVFVITGVDDLKEMIGCFEDFGDAYLVKPISLVSLLRHMRFHQLVPSSDS